MSPTPDRDHDIHVMDPGAALDPHWANANSPEQMNHNIPES
jgi:hypothetical protein